MLSFDQKFSRASISLGIKAKVFTIWLPCYFSKLLSLLYPLFTLLQPLWPPCCSLNMSATFHRAFACVLVQSSISWFPHLRIFMQKSLFHWDFFWLLYLIMHLFPIPHLHICHIEFLCLIFLLASVMLWIVSLKGYIESPQYLWMWFYLEIVSL